MLNELGLKYVVLGHSERRQYFGETDAIINAKIKKAIAAGITPIFCIGETKDERLGGILEPVLEIQLKGGLKDLTPEEVSNLVIAYEPVWAIGTGLTATSKEAQEAHSFIRKVISDVFGADAAAKVRIQYGGSVKPENVEELMAQPDIDGALGGRRFPEAGILRCSGNFRQISGIRRHPFYRPVLHGTGLFHLRSTGLALFTQERSFCLFKRPKSCIMAGNHENPLTYPTQQRFHAH